MQLLTDNIADSWMLLPALFCFFTPSFITNIGCVYAGLVIPSLNSIKVSKATSTFCGTKMSLPRNLKAHF